MGAGPAHMGGPHSFMSPTLDKLSDRTLSVSLFLLLLAAWLFTHNENIWGLTNTIFGVIVGFLTGRASKQPDDPHA